MVRRRITAGEVAAGPANARGPRRPTAYTPTSTRRCSPRRDRRQSDRPQSLQRIHAALSGRHAGDRGRVVRCRTISSATTTCAPRKAIASTASACGRAATAYHFVNADFLRLDTRAHEGFLSQQYAAMFALPPTFDPLKEWRLELLAFAAAGAEVGISAALPFARRLRADAGAKPACRSGSRRGATRG